MGDGVQKKYAIIINGDTEPPHLSNVENAVKALRAEDSSFEISVVGTTPPAGAAVARFEKADDAGLQRLIAGIAPQIDDDDLLVVYVTGHGDKGDKNEGCVALPGSCFSLNTLKEELAKLKYGKRVVVMDQCYSGKGMPLFADSKSVVVTQGSPSEQVSCQLFSPHFWSDKVTDIDRDGIITIQERYAYALAAGRTSTLTQYYSPGAEIALSGKEDKTPPFKPEVVHVYDDAALQRQLARLKPGEQALVMFGASWCGPCKTYLPTFGALAKKYGGRFLMIHAEARTGDPDKDQEWLKKYGVGATPTVAFVDGRVIDGIRKVTLAEEVNDPAKRLLKAALQDPASEAIHYLARLFSPDREIQGDALEKLGELGEHAVVAVPQLIQLLDHKDPFVVRKSAAALGKIGKQAAPAVPQLLRLLGSHPHVDIILALAQIGEPAWSVFPAVAKKVDPKHFNGSVQGISLDDAFEKFAENFSSHAPELIALLSDPDPRVQVFAANVLGKMKGRETEIYPHLLPLLKSHARQEEFRSQPSKILAGMAMNSPAVFKNTIDLLKAGDADLRLGAVKALDWIPTFAQPPDEIERAETNKAILPLLKDPDAAVREEAIRFLTDRRNVADQSAWLETEKWLVEMLNDPAAAVRAEAVASLGKIGNDATLRSVRPTLLEMLTDKEATIRDAAAGTFSKIASDNDTVSLLLPLAKDASPHVRKSIAKIVGGKISPDSTPELLQTLFSLLKDQEVGVRRMAVAGLTGLAVHIGRQGGKKEIVDLVLNKLVPLLRDPDPKVREGIVGELYYIAIAAPSRIPQIVPSLVSALGDSDGYVLDNAKHALKNLGLQWNEKELPAARPLLVASLSPFLKNKDPQIRLVVFESLLNLSGTEKWEESTILPRLITFLEEETDADVLKEARLLLRRKIIIPEKGNPRAWTVGVGPSFGISSSGPEAGLHAGVEYRWGHWGVTAQATGSLTAEGKSLGGSVGPVYHFNPQGSYSRWDPYLVLPVGGSYLFGPVGNDFAAISVNPAGAGVRLFLTPDLSLNGAIKGRVDILMDGKKVKAGVEVPLGVEWRF